MALPQLLPRPARQRPADSHGSGRGAVAPAAAVLAEEVVKQVLHVVAAVVVVAAKFAVQSIKDLMEKGAKWITLVTGGFAESKTKEGRDAQVSIILFL